MRAVMRGGRAWLVHRACAHLLRLLGLATRAGAGAAASAAASATAPLALIAAPLATLLLPAAAAAGSTASTTAPAMGLPAGLLVEAVRRRVLLVLLLLRVVLLLRELLLRKLLLLGELRLLLRRHLARRGVAVWRIHRHLAGRAPRHEGSYRPTGVRGGGCEEGSREGTRGRGPRGESAEARQDQGDM